MCNKYRRSKLNLKMGTLLLPIYNLDRVIGPSELSTLRDVKIVPIYFGR